MDLVLAGVGTKEEAMGTDSHDSPQREGMIRIARCGDDPLADARLQQFFDGEWVDVPVVHGSFLPAPTHSNTCSS